MATTTRLSFEEFRRLQEAAVETVRYELDEGELILTPSPTPRRNLVCLRLWRALSAFVEKHQLGLVITEVDFRLAQDIVRRPDVAFIARKQLKNFDLDHTPIETVPTLAVGSYLQEISRKISGRRWPNT